MFGCLGKALCRKGFFRSSCYELKIREHDEIGEETDLDWRMCVGGGLDAQSHSYAI